MEDADFEFDFDFSRREIGEEKRDEDPGANPPSSTSQSGSRHGARPASPQVVRRRRITAIAAVAALLLIAVVAVLANRSGGNGGPYHTYLNAVSPIAANSQQAGVSLAGLLSAAHGTTTKAEVIPKLDGLVQRAVSDVQQMQAIRPPAALSSAHVQALAALDLRVRALQGIRDTVAQALDSTNPSSWVPVLAAEVDDLVTSDMIWSDFVRGPAYAVLQAHGIGGTVAQSQVVSSSPQALVTSAETLLVSAAATPATGPVLTSGATGAAVSSWQNQLNAWLKLTGTSQAPLAADGNFGASTQATTQALQTASGLAPSGTVDRATRAALRQALGASVQQSSTNAPTTTPAAGPVSGPLLKQGDSGSDVTSWQRDLNQWLKLGATGQALTADGTFGAATQTATEMLQAAQGLTPDGIVGPSTRRALQQALARSSRR